MRDRIYFSEKGCMAAKYCRIILFMVHKIRNEKMTVQAKEPILSVILWKFDKIDCKNCFNIRISNVSF